MSLPDLPDDDLADLAGRVQAEIVRRTLRQAQPAPAAEEGDGQSLDYRQAAEYLGVSASQLETLKAQGRVPFVRMPATDAGGRKRDGRKILFLRADLDAFRREHRQG
jgi:helix-turn-helix protein